MERDGSINSGHWSPALRPNTLDEDEATASSAADIAGPSEWTAPAPRETDSRRDYMEEQQASTKTEVGLDPAWGIQRRDSEQILSHLARSNSFPEFSSFPTLGVAEQSAALPSTQAEQLLSRQDDTTAVSSANVEASSGIPELAIGSEADQLDMGGDEPYLGSHDNNVHNLEAEVEEVRFQEGMPLLSSEADESEDDRVQPGAPLQSHGALSDDDETSFFDRADAVEPSAPEPPHRLDRKTTSDVFESLHYSARDLPDSPNQEAVDASNAERIPQNLSSLEEVPETVSMGNDDAIWQAALDDDEFLVEDPDDLLPDSEPGSPDSFLASLRASEPPVLEDDRQFSANVSTPPRPEGRPAAHRQSSSNPYAPHQPSTSDMTQISPTTYANLGLSRPGLAPMNSFQNHLQQRPELQQAQSFSDQAKGGYKSPYDLPLELSKPRRRVQAVPQPLGTKSMAPPPRTSSMSSETALQSPFSPTGGSFSSAARSMSNQSRPQPPQNHPSTTQLPGPSAPKGTRSNSAFFEELPMSQRPRPPTAQGRQTPAQNRVVSPPSMPIASPPRRGPTPQQIMPQIAAAQAQVPPTSTNAYAEYQLRPPEKLDPYSDIPLQPASNLSTIPAPPPVTSTRYSPAPPQSLAGIRPSPSPRYSPAPPPQINNTSTNRYTSQPNLTGGPPMATRKPSDAAHVPQALPFQPRTSSPLAYHGRNSNERIDTIASRMPPAHPSSESYTQFRGPSAGSAAPYPIAPPEQTNQHDAFYATRPPQPRRSQTQSPSKQIARSSLPALAEDSMIRPASVHAPAAPIRPFAPMEMMPPTRSHVRQRGLSQSLNFIQPNDGSEHDPLQRWKGTPLFVFGFGGTIVSSFPRHVPRYGAAAGPPAIKPSVGEVHVRNVTQYMPNLEVLNSFPGPLRNKARKKDVLAWMTTYIAAMEQQDVNLRSISSTQDHAKRHEEKCLLWKIVRAFVEHDGILDTGAEARRSINTVLSPELFALDESQASQFQEHALNLGNYQPSATSVKAEPIDPVVVSNIQRHLMRGEREKAAWLAVDHRLWSHAMLIASTLDRTVWRQVAQEFVRQDLKVGTTNTQALSAIYEIFAGNLDESVDELVPPSARAGLQMVSKAETQGPTRNALDGLDKWRETLALVLNNRVPDDARALASLGRLLASYGRVEAAHICYLFSRGPLQPFVFGGSDDPQASVVLLGVDHLSLPTALWTDQEAMILTELFEYATSVLNTGISAQPLPHLQPYKMQHAIILAEAGHRNAAQSYCEAIFSTMKQSTKPSLYYHPLFQEQLEELHNRLKQAPIQGSSSWIPKPNIEKVSGTVWNKFTSFVAGEDSDADSKGSGKEASEIGPFAKVTGTPSLSRSGSQTDIYGSYPSQPVPITAAGSRYAPNGIQSTRSSSELTRGRASLDYSRSPPSASGSQSRPMNSLELPTGVQAGLSAVTANSYQSLSQSPPNNRYQATPPQTSYMARPAFGSPQRKAPESYIPTPPPEQTSTGYFPSPLPLPEHESLQAEYPTYGGYTPQINEPPPVLPSQPADFVPVQSYDATQSYGYDPPTDTGYVPYQPDPDSEDDNVKPKPTAPTQSMGNEDEDYFPPMTTQSSSYQPTPSTTAFQPDIDSTLDDAVAKKRTNDAAAEAAFRAAAEADAARDNKDPKGLKPRGSWFGSWIPGGGKKAPDSLDMAGTSTAAAGSSSKSTTGPDGKTVHRAHLGDSKMKFVFNKDLNRWVNPDDPDSLKVKSSTPPPPRMGSGPGPARGLTPSARMPAMPGSGPGSATGGSGPPSRIATPADGFASPPLGFGGSASQSPMLSARPSSSGGIGGPIISSPLATGGADTPPPQSLAAVASGLAPPPRPASNMSTASSIDDLLGPVSAGGGRRTVKGKKGGKAGRYIDVMAK